MQKLYNATLAAIILAVIARQLATGSAVTWVTIAEAGIAVAFVVTVLIIRGLRRDKTGAASGG